LLPLDDLIKKHSTNYKNLLEQFPSLAKAGMKSDGKIYEFARLNEVRPQNGIVIRKDWLDKLGLEVPKTTEDLYLVAKAFAERDPDGNGQKDTYGLSLSDKGNSIIDLMFQNVRWVIKDGVMIHDWDNAKASISFKERLYDEGIIDKDYLNDSNGAKAKKDFVTGKLGIYPLAFGWNNISAQLLQPLRKNVPGAEIIPIAFPAAPAGAFNPLYSNPVQTSAVINANAKNPEAVMKYVDFLVDPKTVMTLRDGLEGVHYKLNETGCPQPIDAGKNTKEIDYISSDLSMLANSTFATEGKCSFESTLNMSNPADKDVYDMFKAAEKAYFDFSRKNSQFTFPEHMPQLPDQINVTSGELFKQIEDLWVKAIVSGLAYSAEQADVDAKALWNKGNGKAADDWMKDWYAKNKDTAFLAEDLYQIAKQQIELKNKAK
jgi:putative aldouronate transport system substrate-binding protein